MDTFEPVTKWNAQLNDSDIVHEAVRKAFRLAEREKPGATHLELPEDVAAAETEMRPLAPPDDGGSGARPAEASLAQAASLFEGTERPLVLVGNGAVRTDAADELRLPVETLGLPVASTYMGKGAVSDADSRSLMTFDSGDPSTATVVERADLVVTVGYDVAEHDPDEWRRPEGAPLVHVDSEPAEVYERDQPTVEFVGDIEATLGELRDRLADREFDAGWYADHRRRLVESTALSDDHSTEPELERDLEAPFALEETLPFLRAALAPADVLISDVGQHKMVIAQGYPTFEANTCVVSNGLASMGIAVPGALAADLALDVDVVAATGDGGFLMNAAELATAARMGCGYTVVVFDDADYRLISEKQRAARDEHFGTELTNHDFVAFAESFGVDAYRPETGGKLAAALESVDDERTSLVAVPVE